MGYVRINEIHNDGSIDIDEVDRINDTIEAMLITRELSIPGSRGFGLSQDFIDMPVPDAINMITVELMDKMDEYMPEVELQDIKGESDIYGNVVLDIYVGRRIT